jgi:hypothetical protein
MSIRQDTDPVPLADAVDELLAELERRDAERARWFTWWCRGWHAGYAAGRTRIRQAP